MFVSPIELPWDGNIVRGKLSGRGRQEGCRWVRLASPLAESEYAETKASESGDFVLENVKPGKYVLTTIGDQGVCEMTPVTVLDKPVQYLQANH